MTSPRVLRPAQEELREAARWYEQQRTGLGIEFLGAIDAALALIGEAPLRFPPWTVNPRFRRLVLQRFPYIIYYHLPAGDPVVVAVAHTSRQPGYWVARVVEDHEEP